jgi:hypothetical protein
VLSSEVSLVFNNIAQSLPQVKPEAARTRHQLAPLASDAGRETIAGPVTN